MENSMNGHLARLLVEEIGRELTADKNYRAPCPMIPCEWTGYHPDSSLPAGSRTNLLPDFTWEGVAYVQRGDRLVPVNVGHDVRAGDRVTKTVYRVYNHEQRMTRALIPDDPDGKNRARLARMAADVKKGLIRVAPYRALSEPTESRSLLESLSGPELDALAARIASEAAARTQEPQAATQVEPTPLETPAETPAVEEGGIRRRNRQESQSSAF